MSSGPFSRSRLGNLKLKIGLLVLLAASCQEPSPGPSAGSNSNWLMACSADRDCRSGAACYCGSCTRECSDDADCGDFANARCATSTETAYQSQCRTSGANSGICLPLCQPGTCSEDQVCLSGSCVLASLPVSDLCSPLAAASAEQRTWEDELLVLLNETRAAGGVTCGGDAPSVAVGELRVDGRLRCAARLFGSDLAVTRSRALVDSLGRDSQQRMDAAGYAPRFWAEAFAFRASAPSDALSMMLSDAESCRGLMAANNEDVGVAHIQDVDVLTLGAE